MLLLRPCQAKLGISWPLSHIYCAEDTMLSSAKSLCSGNAKLMHLDSTQRVHSSKKQMIYSASIPYVHKYSDLRYICNHMLFFFCHFYRHYVLFVLLRCYFFPRLFFFLPVFLLVLCFCLARMCCHDKKKVQQFQQCK